MKTTTENLIAELWQMEVGKELRSELLAIEILKKQEELFSSVEGFSKLLDKNEGVLFSALEEKFYDYCEICNKEAFHHGFKLGLKLAQEK